MVHIISYMYTFQITRRIYIYFTVSKTTDCAKIILPDLWGLMDYGTNGELMNYGTSMAN